MKLLLIEDDDNKRKQLGGFVSSTWPTAVVETARSLKSALRALRKSDMPDVVLLDMTLPTFDISAEEAGGSTHAYGGREFLKEVRRFMLPMPVVVVTQYEAFGAGADMMTLNALDSELRRDFPLNYRGYVYYHAAIESWKVQLKDIVERALDQERP